MFYFKVRKLQILTDSTQIQLNNAYKGKIIKIVFYQTQFNSYY